MYNMREVTNEFCRFREMFKEQEAKISALQKCTATLTDMIRAQSEAICILQAETNKDKTDITTYPVEYTILREYLKDMGVTVTITEVFSSDLLNSRMKLEHLPAFAAKRFNDFFVDSNLMSCKGTGYVYFNRKDLALYIFKNYKTFSAFFPKR